MACSPCAVRLPVLWCMNIHIYICIHAQATFRSTTSDRERKKGVHAQATFRWTTRCDRGVDCSTRCGRGKDRCTPREDYGPQALPSEGVDKHWACSAIHPTSRSAVTVVTPTELAQDPHIRGKRGPGLSVEIPQKWAGQDAQIIQHLLPSLQMPCYCRPRLSFADPTSPWVGIERISPTTECCKPISARAWVWVYVLHL